MTATRSEYEPASFLIKAQDSERIEDVTLTWSDLEGPQTLEAAVIDARLCKVWWAAHPMVRMGHSDWAKQGTPEKYWKPFLTQELLLHDEKLIRVNRDPQHYLNEVRVRDLTAGTDTYYPVSRPDARLPTENMAIHLAPFNIPKGQYTQIWLTIHVPRDATSGKYRSTLTLRSAAETMAKLTLCRRNAEFAEAQRTAEWKQKRNERERNFREGDCRQ